MKTRTVYSLLGSIVISAFCIFGLDACSNDSGYTSGEKAVTADTTAAAAKDSVAGAAGASGATAKIPAKKRKSTAMMTDYSKEKMTKDKDGVYNTTEVMPQFPGGSDGLNNYVSDHLQYTQMALDQNTTGIVKVSFIIDENGKVSHAQLMSPSKIGNGLDEEALRVVNNMPTWKPGKVKGKNVKTRLELPISFQVEG